MKLALLLFCTAILCGSLIACAQRSGHPSDAQNAEVVVAGQTPTPLVRRTFEPIVGQRWIGNGISYGAHRDGQRPGGPGPTREQLREDLRLLAQHWNLLRMYSSQGGNETVLELIREEHLPMKVMLGAWIAQEARLADGGIMLEEFPQARAANRAEIEGLVRLTNAYPDIVIAASVGNETQVFWSGHKVPTETLIRFIREVRSRVKVSVTTADDFNYWNKPESKFLAREVDFIVTHIYAMWAGQPLDRALPFTQEKYAEVAKMHPDHVLVLGEAGWATRMHTEGEQAKLIKGETGEAQQKTFYDQYLPWTTSERIVNFYFEAFDENWKGGPHPDEVEKHWGLYKADRTPKLAIQGAK